MSQISWLLEAARKIEVIENIDTTSLSDNVCNLINKNTQNSNNSNIIEFGNNTSDLIKIRQSRSNNGRFLSKKYDKTQSKYVGIYINEGKWVAYVNKEKHRFATKDNAEKFFEDECKKLKIDPNIRLRSGYKIK